MSDSATPLPNAQRSSQEKEVKQLAAGAPFSIPLRCRLNWHKWTKWGAPIGLKAGQWNSVIMTREPTLIQQQVRNCSDCDLFQLRVV